jgi:hypothetical protein
MADVEVATHTEEGTIDTLPSEDVGTAVEAEVSEPEKEPVKAGTNGVKKESVPPKRPGVAGAAPARRPGASSTSTTTTKPAVCF